MVKHETQIYTLEITMAEINKLSGIRMPIKKAISFWNQSKFPSLKHINNSIISFNSYHGRSHNERRRKSSEFTLN